MKKIAAVALSCLILVGCSAPLEEAEPAEEPKTQVVEEAEPTEEPVAEPVKEEVGTLGNPFPADTVLVSKGNTGQDEASILIGASNWDATALVMDENQFNTAPPEGFTYVLTPVTVTNIASAEPIVAWLDATVAYVTPDGRSFDTEFAVIPGDLSDSGDLYPGGVASGNIAFLVPVDALGGLWAVSRGWSAERVFVTAH